MQPPSGGCVLKPDGLRSKSKLTQQPPSGGCVLKQRKPMVCWLWLKQPPSGGCVLKHEYLSNGLDFCVAAAFGRLCVETFARPKSSSVSKQPPSGGCVLKLLSSYSFSL